MRLPIDYECVVPDDMILKDVEEANYLVFKHGPFNYEQENRSVENKIEEAMKSFDFTSTKDCFDFTKGRVFYLYFDPSRSLKYVRPVKKIKWCIQIYFELKDTSNILCEVSLV